MDVRDLRAIQWGRNYWWDILFPEAPAPFNSWFPASEVEEEVANLTAKQLEIWMSTYSIPESRAQRKVNVTFYDTENLTLLNWIEDWINNGIFNVGGDGGVSPLEECCKELLISKHKFLDTGEKKMVKQTQYWVFPNLPGGISYVGSSSNIAVPQYTVEFTIAGVLSVRGR